MSSLDILREIADENPIRFDPVLYGQGGGGDVCRYCGADDGYDGGIHKPRCKWLRARVTLGLSAECGIDGCVRWLGHEINMNRGPQVHRVVAPPVGVLDAHPTFPAYKPSPYVSLYITRKQAEAVQAMSEGRSVPKRMREAVRNNVLRAMARNA